MSCANTMIRGVAIVGKSDEPLYLYGCKEKDASTEDHFGFSETNLAQGTSMSLKDQVMVHASLDCLEEMVSTLNGQMPVIKKPTASHPHWVGLLLEDDGLSVYAHITATNIKFLCLVEGVCDVEVVQKLLADIHTIYVEQVLNPFFDTRGPIRSSNFDEKVRRAVPGCEVIEC